MVIAIQEALPTLTNNITLAAAIAAAIATVVASIFVGWVNVITARAAAQKSIAPIAEAVHKIEAHVNSEKTRDQGILAAKDVQIKLQQDMIEELKRVSALLAQAQATRDLGRAVADAALAGATVPTHTAQVPPSSQALVTGPATVVLKEIEKNTKETAVNTQKTDDAMQEMKDAR